MPDAATRAYNRLEEAHKKPLDAAIIRRMWDYLRPHRRAVLVNVAKRHDVLAFQLLEVPRPLPPDPDPGDIELLARRCIARPAQNAARHNRKRPCRRQAA